MGYDCIQLSKNASDLCKIIYPWVKTVTKNYQWELHIHQIFPQHKMNDLFHGFESIRVYVDDILVLKKGDWTYHVQVLGSTLIELRVKDLSLILEIISSIKPK